MVVSTPGIDVGTVTDPDKIIFSSDYNTLKYASEGSINLSWSSGSIVTSSTAVAHGATGGTKPLVFAFANQIAAGTYELMPYHSAGLPFINNLNFFVDGTNINFVFTGAASLSPVAAGTVTFKYFIFKNNTGL